ncbi:MAG TPA: hypothetical protein VGM79_09560 [Streptosporangiaceae bacterium]|jgi:predicted RNA polymerase sigma factor
MKYLFLLYGEPTRWPQLHVAIGELSRQAGRPAAARDAYAEALRLGLAPAQRAFVRRQLAALPPP